MSATDAIFTEEIELGRERLRVEVKQWQGRWIFTAWRFWQNEAGEWKPGKNGVSIRIERMEQFAHAVAKAVETAKTRGIVR
jgi:transcriptional coactivator p15 (PC4)